MRPTLPGPPPDDELAGHLAAALLFTTLPTDRALAGWCGRAEAWDAMEVLEVPSEVAWAACCGTVRAGEAA